MTNEEIIKALQTMQSSDVPLYQLITLMKKQGGKVK